MTNIAPATTTPTLTPKNLGGLPITKPEDGEHKINILVYGDPGVGKTVFAASSCEVEDMGPVLIVDVEGGTLSLKRTHPNVDVVRIKSYGDFNKIYAALREGKTGYKTVVLDSISEIQKFGMFAIMRQVVAADPERDVDLPGIGEWGKNTEQVRKLVRAFRDLPVNTIITALAANDLSETGVIRKTKPSLSAKLSMEIPGFFDVVGYMYIKERKDPSDPKAQPEQVRCMLTMATSNRVAKDRTGILPPVIEYPTMQKIINIINGEPTS